MSIACAPVSRALIWCGYCPAALLLAASGAIATEPEITPKFPESPNPYFGLAEIVARPGKAVRFTELLESQCEESPVCSEKDEFVVAGDRLVTGGIEHKRVYAWFPGRRMRLRGWLPAVNVKAMSIDQHPALKKWEGAWTAGVVHKISIKADPAARQLAVEAHAEWYGGQLANGEQVIHTGDVEGKAAPDGNRLVIRTGSNSEDCILVLELLGEFMGAVDNMHCGGMNVGFSDAYTRKSGAGDPR
jgi:hypothetical protein